MVKGAYEYKIRNNTVCCLGFVGIYMGNDENRLGLLGAYHFFGLTFFISYNGYVFNYFLKKTTIAQKGRLAGTCFSGHRANNRCIYIDDIRLTIRRYGEIIASFLLILAYFFLKEPLTFQKYRCYVWNIWAVSEYGL
ncbi:hypothetical protein J2S00_003954 [Caldalkalibacillus uzonensis]|uniref:Uncharacterized protein n=1 Tax=Caldalkalibacillus uzonensis TaxID=353224 RepID=A0ABU0CY89_9BACI|nr:hypothetical protein [Caldalkalibacillus uzonensis]MDQ0341110.1 hypothetical protein [Caldalkalibacillus uzonensis]